MKRADDAIAPVDVGKQMSPDRIATQSDCSTNCSVLIIASISITSATSTPWVWK